MMDRERQEKDLQKVFETTQGAYRPAVEDTFALQEQTLEFARKLFKALPKALRTQSENDRATPETLSEQSKIGAQREMVQRETV